MPANNNDIEKHLWSAAGEVCCISEQQDEESLALFDLLTRPAVKLTRKQREQVKAVARDLLNTLTAERLVLDWRKKQQTRAALQLTIEEFLDRLPEPYDLPLYEQKCQAVYQHVYDAYYREGKSIYSTVGSRKQNEN